MSEQNSEWLETAKAAKEFFDWVTDRIGRISYELEELEKSIEQIEAWKELDGAKFDGIFAAWNQQFEEYIQKAGGAP